MTSLMKTYTGRLLAVLLAAQVSAAADLRQQVDELIPKLADPQVEARHASQLQLQQLAAQASRPGAESERASLARILADRIAKPATPQPAKVWLVRQLEYLGDDEAVPALTQLLNGEDQELRECARRALEKNNARSAARSVRQALKASTDSHWQIGLISALGEQRDSEAVPVIIPFLDRTGTAEAAAMALAKIASPEAIQALRTALRGRHARAGVALVCAADVLLIRDEKDQARTILNDLCEPGQPVELRAAALAGLIRASPADAAVPVGSALGSSAPELQQAAIQAVAADPAQLLPILVKALPALPEPAQIQALDVVDASAETVVLELARGGQAGVRRAALAALGRVGGTASVPVLIQAAATQGAPEKAASQAALARLAGPGVNEAILGSAAKGPGAERAAAIRALADRGQRDALPRLVAFAGEADEGVRAASLSALRNLGSDAEVKPLAEIVARTGSGDAGAALRSAVSRAGDKAAAGRVLVEISRQAQGEGLTLLMDAMTLVGGREALAVLESGLASADDTLKTAALRALGNWPDFAAAEPLWKVAADPQTDATQQILAIRGLAQLAKGSSAEEPEKRVQLIQKTMALAKRVEEKKLLISALGAVGHRAAIAEIGSALRDQALRQEAAAAGLQLAEALAKSDPAEARALAKTILDADVSAAVNKSARRLTGK